VTFSHAIFFDYCRIDARSTIMTDPLAVSLMLRTRLGNPVIRSTSAGLILILITLATLTISAGTTRAAIKTEILSYQEGQVQARSILTYDDSVLGRRPGVLVVPEWWGLNDYTRMRARMLASLGYVALAVDVYGDGRNTSDPKQADAWAEPLQKGDRAELRTRIKAALIKLKSQARVDPEKTAAIGYCFGGTTVLELARSGAEVDGVASFHGHLETKSPARPGEVKARILVLTGAEDSFVSADQVEAFEDEMRKAGTDWEVNVYSGAKHSFTNPAADSYHVPGMAYNRIADSRSWQAMRDFFHEIFK
jgi:dienelactone hydrolase